MTGSKVCTNRGDVEVEEDGLTTAERNLVGPLPVRRRTNPIGGGPEAEGSLRQKEGFFDAQGSLLTPNRLVGVRRFRMFSLLLEHPMRGSVLSSIFAC